MARLFIFVFVHGVERSILNVMAHFVVQAPCAGAATAARRQRLASCQRALARIAREIFLVRDLFHLCDVSI